MSKVKRLLLVSLLVPAFTANAQETELLEQINELRAAPALCDERDAAPVHPLRADQRLGNMAIQPDEMQEALREVGYQAAVIQLIAVSGPATAEEALDALTPDYCDALLDPAFSEIGIRRENDTWQLLLAQRLLDQDMGSWEEEGRAVLEFTNQARQQPRSCGNARFDPAPPLAWNPALASAALAHSRDMAGHNYFSHEGRDGGFADTRADRAGYQWQRVGENLAAGSGSAQEAVAGWLQSPEHCVNLMNPDFTEMGAAYVVNPDSDVIIYWTQVFGTPR